MKKTHTFLSVTAILLAGFALAEQQEQPSAPVAMPAEAPAPEPEPQHPGSAHLAVALEYAMAYDELGLLLQQVTDWSSANKAVPEAEKIVNNLADITARMSQLPAPTAEIENYVTERLSQLNTPELAEQALGRVIDLLTLADPPCHGSRELESVLLRLTKLLIESE